MTRYYIDLKDYSDSADIKDVCDETLKEVFKDFNVELQKRGLTLPIDNVNVSLITEEEVEKKAEFRAKPRKKDNDANEEFIHGFMQGANWVINKVSPDER